MEWWCGVVLRGAVGMVWRGAVWRGVAWYGIAWGSIAYRAWYHFTTSLTKKLQPARTVWVSGKPSNTSPEKQTNKQTNKQTKKRDHTGEMITNKAQQKLRQY